MDGLHARAKEVFLRACELDGAAREEYLESALSGDATLRAAVLELLANDADPPAFLRDADSGGGVRRLAREIAEFEEDGLPLPERIGSYRVIRLVGRGGMGIVYEVEQENPRRRVALKIVATGSGSRGSLRRLRNEAQILARLKHPGIAQIHEAGSSEVHGVVQPWFAMELVDGATLTEHARHDRLDIAARVALVADVCDAVQHAHEAGVLHCDLKAANVVVDAEGRPKVIDFGVARILERIAGVDSLVTATGTLAGTLATMSPEHVARGPRHLDERSDVYSLGVIAYELLTGRPPLDVADLSVPEAARRICEDSPPRAGALVPELSGDLETILAKALAKDRDHRYASARALAEDLRRWLTGRPIAARPPSAAYRLRLFARRNRALSAAAAVAAAALVALAAFAAWTWEREGVLRTRTAATLEREDVLSAQRALRAGNPVLARSLLESARARSAHWEWRRLHRELHGWIAEFPSGERLVDAGFSAGATAFAAAHDGTFFRLDALTGRELSRLPGAPARARTVAARPNGAACVAFGDGELLLWDSATGDAIRTLPLVPGARTDPRGAARFSPSGRWLAVRGQLHDLAGPASAPEAVCAGFVAFSSEPEFLAAQDRGVAIVEPGRGDSPRTIDLGFVPLAIALDPSARRLAASDTTRVHLHDLVNGSRSTLAAAHVHAPNALAFRPDGARLVALQDDGSFLVHDPGADRVVLRGWGGRSAWMSTVAWNADGTLLLTAGWAHGIVRVWDAREDAEVLRGHASFVYPVAYTPDGERIVSGGWDRTVRVWSAATNELLATFGGLGRHRVQALAVSPDGGSVVGAGDDGALVAWDLGTGAERARFLGPAVSGALAWSARAVIAAASSEPGGSVSLHRAGDLVAVETLTLPGGGVHALAYSRDGALLAAGTDDGSVAIWELDRGREPRIVASTGRIRCLSFSPDGRELVAAGDAGLVTVIDVERGAARAVLRGHAREVFAAAFSPDGTRIASGGRDGTLRLWDAASGEEVGTFEGHSDYIWSLAFHPGGDRIVTGSGDGTLRQWESEPAAQTYRRRYLGVRAAQDAVDLVDRRLREDPSLPRALEWLAGSSGPGPEALQAARNEILRRGARKSPVR